MRCSYCFYNDVIQSRSIPSRGIMSIDTLSIILKKSLKEATQFVSFVFQGGEPMLAGLNFFKEFIALQKKFNINSIQVFNSIQTNGILIDEEWARFLADNHFLVGLSIDGCKDVHNALRLDANGKGTHKKCMRAATILEEAGAEFNILSVLTKNFALYPDKAYEFYKKNNMHYIQLIPCLDRLNEIHGSNPYSLNSKLFGSFLCRFFDLWYADFINGDYYSVRMFDNYIRMLMGEEPESCGMIGYCQSYPVIEADGDVYPCDFYVLDNWKMGNIHTDSFADMLNNKVSKNFIKSSYAVCEKCSGCSYFPICRNGCRRDREQVSQSSLGLNYYCDGYKKFFDYALPRMQDIARKMPR